MVRFPFVALALLVLLSAVVCKRINSIAGPWNAILQDFKRCESSTEDLRHQVYFLHITRRYNGTLKRQVLRAVGEFQTALQRSNNLQMDVNVAKWDSVAGWRDNFFVLNLGHPCDMLETTGKRVWAVFINESTPQIPRKCPLPKATYVVENVVLAFDQFGDIPVLQYGKYKARLRLVEAASSIIKLCGDIIYTVVPKEY